MHNSIFLSPAQIKPSTVCLPGSKSISNRALLLAALSTGQTEVTNLLYSDDTTHMLNALEKLGIHIQKNSDHHIQITGNGGTFNNHHAELFLGNAGTAFRPLTAVLSLQQGEYHLSGVPRMHERPIKDLVDALQQLGASIEYLEKTAYPPLLIHPFNAVQNSHIEINGNVSSQFLTALLIALPLLKQAISVKVQGELISKPYIDITLNLIQRFGVTIRNNDYLSFDISADSQYIAPKQFLVEGDASSASYFLAAAFLTGNAITIEGIGKNSIQGDTAFIHVLESLGADTNWQDTSITLSRKKGQLIPHFNINANHIPDAAMTLAIIALAAQGTSTISNIASWRVKETDRITAMKIELEKLGATVVETEDSISITPPAQLNQNIAIDTYDDHRMAMCFSLISLLDTPIIINDPECVNKTFPNYFELFASIQK